MTFEFRVYHRPFRQPLVTAHGAWAARAGILLRSPARADSGAAVHYGEITPLPWFGSESLAAAIAACQDLQTLGLTDPQSLLAAIPASLPATQFGFETLFSLEAQRPLRRSPAVAALLSNAATALEDWPQLWAQGYRTFKWKIVPSNSAAEFEVQRHRLVTLRSQLPREAKLRLDANGGLTPELARRWLDCCDRLEIEFLEQPLPPGQFDQMCILAQQFSTPLALDESVATLVQLQRCHARGWPGLYVIKPAIAGSPSQLRRFCQAQGLDVVLSSVFETAIGQQAGLSWLAELSSRAVGYGLDHWFPASDPLLGAKGDQLWQRLAAAAP